MNKQAEIAKLERELNDKEAWIKSQINTPDMFRRVGFSTEAANLERKIKEAHEEIIKMVEKYNKLLRGIR